MFVQEAAELDDLNHFSSIKDLTSEEEARTRIGIASGVYALHRKGIIHSDLTPRNILVHKGGQNSFIAKLSNFSSSILLPTWQSNSQLHGGTKLWQASETNQIHESDELMKAEIYHLGLLIWYVFTTKVAACILEFNSWELEESKASGDLLDTARKIVAGLFPDDDQGSGSEQILLKQCLVISTLACQNCKR